MSLCPCLWQAGTRNCPSCRTERVKQGQRANQTRPLDSSVLSPIFSSYIQQLQSTFRFGTRQQHEAPTRDSSMRQQHEAATPDSTREQHTKSSTRQQHKKAAIYQWHHSSNVCCKPLTIVESAVHFCVPRAAQKPPCTHPILHCSQYAAHSTHSTVNMQHYRHATQQPTAHSAGSTQSPQRTQCSEPQKYTVTTAHTML